MGGQIHYLLRWQYFGKEITRCIGQFWCKTKMVKGNLYDFNILRNVYKFNIVYSTK